MEDNAVMIVDDDDDFQTPPGTVSKEPSIESSKETSSKAEAAFMNSVAPLETENDCVFYACTVCFNPFTESLKVVEHPALKLGICDICYARYCETDFEYKDQEDQHQDICTWCAIHEEGSLFLCDFCPKVFCKACITNNFTKEELKEIEETDMWRCFHCDMGPIKEFQDNFKIIYKRQKKHSRRRRKLEKLTRNAEELDRLNQLNCDDDERARLKKKLEEKSFDDEGHYFDSDSDFAALQPEDITEEKAKEWLEHLERLEGERDDALERFEDEFQADLSAGIKNELEEKGIFTEEALIAEIQAHNFILKSHLQRLDEDVCDVLDNLGKAGYDESDIYTQLDKACVESASTQAWKGAERCKQKLDKDLVFQRHEAEEYLKRLDFKPFVVEENPANFAEFPSQLDMEMNGAEDVDCIIPLAEGQIFEGEEEQYTKKQQERIQKTAKIAEAFSPKKIRKKKVEQIQSRRKRATSKREKRDSSHRRSHKDNHRPEKNLADNHPHEQDLADNHDRERDNQDMEIDDPERDTAAFIEEDPEGDDDITLLVTEDVYRNAINNNPNILNGGKPKLEEDDFGSDKVVDTDDSIEASTNIKNDDDFSDDANKDIPVIDLDSEDENEVILIEDDGDDDLSTSSANKRFKSSDGDTIPGRNNDAYYSMVERIKQYFDGIDESEIIATIALRQKNRLQVQRASQGPDDTFWLDEKNKEVPVDANIVNYLKKHQMEGIRFMFNHAIGSLASLKNEDQGAGCLLAHSMGLGKTLQVVTFVHSILMLGLQHVGRVIIVVPSVTLHNWQNEFKKWINFESLFQQLIYYIDPLEKMGFRLRKLEKWFCYGGVMIIGHRMFTTLINDDRVSVQSRSLLKTFLQDPGPDLIIVDESHNLKSAKSQFTQALQAVKTTRRIALTGSPLQNNLSEYYQLVKFINDGFLGDESDFDQNFKGPIEAGEAPEATLEEIKIMTDKVKDLWHKLHSIVHRVSYTDPEITMPNKHEYVLTMKLDRIALELERGYHMYAGKEKSNSVQMTAKFRPIWAHPYTLLLRSQKPDRPDDKSLVDPDWWRNIIPDIKKYENISYGPKVEFLFDLLSLCRVVRDKTLIFSQSLITLQYLATKLNERGYKFFMMHGSIGLTERQRMIDRFNSSNCDTSVFLISTKAGGVGVNLYGANRVVIMDTSWNPMDDQQAIHRAYRHGQKKPVYVYRLVAHDTMEETNIYQKQIVKIALSSRVIDDKRIAHYSTVASQVKEQTYTDISKVSDTLLRELLKKYFPETVQSYHQHDILFADLGSETLNAHEEREVKDLGIELQRKASHALQRQKIDTQNRRKRDIVRSLLDNFKKFQRHTHKELTKILKD